MGVSRPVLTVICALAGACTVEGGIGRDPRQTRVVADVPDRFHSELDLLFVVDNTADSAGLQRGLSTALAHIHEYLLEVEDGRLDLHIGVISSDLGSGGVEVPGCSRDGDAGVLQVATADPACASLGDGWVHLRRDGGRFEGNLPGLGDGAVDSDAIRPLLDQGFACLAALAPTACPYPQPLAALERALAPDANPGFVRDGAALGVVVVAGEDDCSASDPSFFTGSGAATFRCFDRGVDCDGDDVGLAIGAQRGCRAAVGGELTNVAGPAATLGARKPSGAVVVAGAVGDTDDIVIVENDDDDRSLLPACERDQEAIYPSVRLGDFVGRFAHRALEPMCAGGAAAIGAPAGAQLRLALGQRCLEGDIRDIDDGTAGLQWDCTVTAVAADGARTSLAACDWAFDPMAGPGPCFVIRPGRCTDFPTQLAVTVNWGGAEPTVAPLGVRTEVACQVDDPASDLP